MKYILLDTNIIIDMFIDRRHQVTDSVLASFIKLLDYDEIRLIVPEIVKTETYRHLDEELTIMGKQIHKVMREIEGLYGVSTYHIQGLDIKPYKDFSRRELAKAYDNFQQNEANYRNELKKVADMVFEHKNSITICCDEFLTNAVTKRRIFKCAPFHIESKDSFGDGLITETLINICRYADVKKDDIIYFVTGNYTDFCKDKDNKEIFHEHIEQDLKSSGIPCHVKCVNTFGKLIFVELKENVEAANLSFEFEKQMEEEYAEAMAAYQMDIINMDRECVDLVALDGYESYLEEDLVDSKMNEDITEAFERINSTLGSYEEGDYSFLYNEICNILKSSSLKQGMKLFEKVIAVCKEEDGFPDLMDSKEITMAEAEEIIHWLEVKENYFDKIENMGRLPDSIYYGDVITIFDADLCELTFCLDSLELKPSPGEEEWIDITLHDSKNERSASGKVKLMVGYINFDEDGGIADGTLDDIDYNYEMILEQLDLLADKWEERKAIESKISEELGEEFGLLGY